ncbi:SDR family NAD(P)-dependent oxidoreductase [Novosphingobium piscinae]|uniref:SDR family oxidoreductase n=1 Tax=Novosphingobium piscinae TaxID=1507448 RepID=A0A7X1KQ00_9SPHN|nr:SDR family NAD(P)-dependent oxidoreductase [Novosphingobium piscinae]MBC2668998.1 SDR family oxidoreductase [Novosphingobium piscinae]
MDAARAGRLQGRSALVTGAGSGIGRATAARLAAEGARVYTVDLQGPVDRQADVTAPGINAALVSEVVARHGGLDILVPCAGISAFHPLEDHDDGYFEQVMAVNVTAVFRLIRDAVPALRQSAHGRIVTIGSTMARFGDAGLVAYAASKHAVLGLTRAAACELGPHGITVNCLQPGAIETPMTAPAFTAMPEFKAYFERKAALGRLGQPEDVADVIAFLCSDDARFMTGQGFFVDGGAMTRQ